MIKKILPHILIILAVVLLVFLIIDQVNAAMAFVNNQGTKIIMMIFCVLVLGASIYAIWEDRRDR